jgi:hypothetical protein
MDRKNEIVKPSQYDFELSCPPEEKPGNWQVEVVISRSYVYGLNGTESECIQQAIEQAKKEYGDYDDTDCTITAEAFEF